MTDSLETSETITDLGAKTYVLMGGDKTKNPALDAGVKEIMTRIQNLEAQIGILVGKKCSEPDFRICREASLLFRKPLFLSTSGGRSPLDRHYLCISISDILCCILIILFCIFSISFAEIFPLPIALDISFMRPDIIFMLPAGMSFIIPDILPISSDI